MKQLIPNVRIIAPNSPRHNEVSNLWLDEGRLLKTPDNAHELADEILDENLCISPSWVELRARSFDPGHPDRESIQTLLSAAEHGGYSHVGIQPDTNPVADGRAMMEYWKGQAVGARSRPIFLGALSKENKGVELSELYDMKQFGAKAFSDATKPIANTLFLKVVMEYASSVGLSLILRPDDAFLFNSGEAREGINSHRCGIPSIPAISEKIGIERLCELASYSQCSIHLTSISTSEGLESLKKWKDSGLDVTADVSIAHLCMDDSGLLEFDSMWKHHPPLANLEVQKVLTQAVISGDIDIVSSDHHPVNKEDKHCEFHLAEEGISSIEATFSLLNNRLGSSSIDSLVRALGIAPRRVLNLHQPEFKEGETAEYTLFDLNSIVNFSSKNWRSRSTNFPFFGDEMNGKVVRSLFNMLIPKSSLS
jgi:dihydroorotase